MKNVLIILVVILIIGAVFFTFLRMTHWVHVINSPVATPTASTSATASPSASSVNGENQFFNKEFATPTPVRRTY